MMDKVVKYCKESYNELVYNTTWPSWKELINSAMVVITASIIIALVIFVMDWVCQHFMEFIYSVLA